MRRDPEKGSAVVESIFGIFVLLALSLGAIQVALTLYARNVVLAAVHDGARAAIEIGGSVAGAEIVAERAIRQSAGGLIDDLSVDIATRRGAGRYFVTVHASGLLVVSGPVPLALPLQAHATATREVFGAAFR